jgi:hypothetical protein
LNMEPEFFKSQNRLNKKMIRSSEPTNCSSLIIFWNDGAVNDIYTQLHGWRPNIQTEILILKPRIRREKNLETVPIMPRLGALSVHLYCTKSVHE